MKPKRIVLVDDHEVFRLGIRTEIEQHSDLEVVAEAESVEAAVEAVAEHRPDVLVLDMDIRGPRAEDGGATVAAALRREGIDVAILVLSAFQREGYVLSMLAEGVAGYVLKSEPLSFIVDAIRGVARGEAGWFSREIMAKITRSRRKGQELTRRELEILQFLHLSNEELADTLHISVPTAKKHVTSILAKLGVPSRAAAVDRAWETGLITRRES